jgi:branched-chain amino acid transport system substrate-binding protein
MGGQDTEGAHGGGALQAELDLRQADLVYFAAQPDDVLAGVAALRGAGITAPILGGDGLDIGATWQQAPHADKIYFTTHAYLGADNPDPRVQAFRALYAKAYAGKQADAFSVLGYDTARLLMAAIKSAGSIQAQAVRKALAATSGFAGVTGTISYRRGSRIPAKSVSIIAVMQGRQSLAASVLPEKIPPP